MSRPPIKKVLLSDPRLSMHLCHKAAEHPEGFWLHDYDAGMNLAVGAPSEIEAFVEAVQYWKKRAMDSTTEYAKLRTHVDQFVQLVSPPQPEGGWL